MKATVFYIVKFWVSSEEDVRYIGWLDNIHIAELLFESGFLWARRCRLEQPDKVGSTGHIMIYGLDSLDSFKRYHKSLSKKNLFGKEKAFKGVHKVERLHGTLDLELASVNHTLDDEAQMIYCAQFSVSPTGGERFFEWLDGGHLAEVIAQPGFLWARRIHLDGRDEDGWERYMIIYGQASHKTLEEYFSNPIRERFFREREAFVKDLRMENFYGAVELALNK